MTQTCHLAERSDMRKNEIPEVPSTRSSEPAWLTKGAGLPCESTAQNTTEFGHFSAFAKPSELYHQHMQKCIYGILFYPLILSEPLRLEVMALSRRSRGHCTTVSLVL
jgi:hypothetical protein